MSSWWISYLTFPRKGSINFRTDSDLILGAASIWLDEKEINLKHLRKSKTLEPYFTKITCPRVFSIIFYFIQPVTTIKDGLITLFPIHSQVGLPGILRFETKLFEGETYLAPTFRFESNTKTPISRPSLLKIRESTLKQTQSQHLVFHIFDSLDQVSELPLLCYTVQNSERVLWFLVSSSLFESLSEQDRMKLENSLLVWKSARSLEVGSLLGRLILGARLTKAIRSRKNIGKKEMVLLLSKMGSK